MNNREIIDNLTLLRNSFLGASRVRKLIQISVVYAGAMSKMLTKVIKSLKTNRNI